MFCFSCNAEIELSADARVGFRDECESCNSDLHVCLNCAFYDTSAYNECREPNSERVSDRSRANRCDYFSPSGLGGGAVETRRSAALENLDALFKK